MREAKLRAALTVMVACFVLAASIFALSPMYSFADTAGDTVAAQKTRNENLIVKYALDDTASGSNAITQLTAHKWDSDAQVFVVDPDAVATVQNHVNNNNVGTVTSAEGTEGSSALKFTGKAHARADFCLPADATGMTVTMWVKNVNSYWSSLVEFWDGTDGGRFGKGTMQGNGGRRNEADPWSANCPAHDSATMATGGGWDSFVINVNNSNNGGAAVDPMVADRWYHVTYTFTENAMHAYRDGALKQTFDTKNDAPKIIKSIMRAVKSGNGKLGIRLGHDPNDGDILDDFRIYNGAMSANEVQALYGEYKGLAAIQGKTVHLDGIAKEYTVDNGNNVQVTSTAADFPKVLIGGVTAADVTLTDGVYSASGNGFSYTYTVGEYVDGERVATVTYTDTATQNTHVFTVTQINKTVIKLSSLQVKVDGVLQDIDGFDADIVKYKLNLSPDNYKLEFVVVVTDGGSSNVATVNAAIDYNGDNVITTSGAGESVAYTVTVSKERADTALPIFNGEQLGYATQNIYADQFPASLAASAVTLAYPNGSTVENFAYNTQTHVATFTVKDKALGTQTNYTVTYKTKQEGHLAQWSFESSVETGSNANKVFRGKRWDATQGNYVNDSSLDMTVRSGGDNSATTDKHTSVAATQVQGVLGNGIELAAWNYTTATIPAVQGGTTGFTFSTWMKTSGIVWEAIFAVCGSEHGTILEKGNMQMHNIVDGQPVNGWEHLHNSTGDWANTSLNSDAAKANYFNTPSNGSSYVFYTVTVTYANGVGTIKFYKDGELAVTFHDHADGGNEKAAIIIDAMNKGASVGLHRHHYDGGQASRFDETNVYAYAMTAAEVKTMYNSIADLLSVSPEYYDVDGLGYPTELLLGGATEVTDGTGGTKSGVTSSGVQYLYTPLTVASTPANDENGIKITFSKNGVVREATVKFRRTLQIKAQTLGYKIGDGTSVPIAVPENAGDDVIVKVAAGTDLSDVKAGDIAVQKLAGDDDATHYKTQFTYSATTHTATVRVSYTVYNGCDQLYTLVFVHKSTDTLDSMQVTGGKSALQLTKSDFDQNTAQVVVDDLTNFTLSMTVSLAQGASLAGGGNTVTFTESDLADGKLTLSVVNENGDSVAYYLVPVTYSSDATLHALSAGEYALNFTAGTTAYTVTADKGESMHVFEAITATATDSHATVKKTYDKTENVVTVTVTAQDGVTVQKYTIQINELDTDATLSGIEVGGVALADFTPQTYAYTVKYAGNMPAVTATANSASAQEPSVSTADANGKVTITVTAENGTQKEYTVTLVKKSSDASLKKLTLNGTEIALEGNTAQYQAAVGTRLSSIVVITETAENANAAYKVAEADKQIVITVKAEDGTTATYTVTIVMTSHGLPEGGVTEDNSPKESGCGSSVNGSVNFAAISVMMAAMLLLAARARKTRERK